MQQKNIWMHYLAVGSSVLILLLLGLSSCSTEYLSQADYRFKNDTSYTVKYAIKGEVDSFELFSLAPHSDTLIAVKGTGEKNVVAEDLGKYYLWGFHRDGGGVPAIITFNNNKCLIYNDGEGSKSIKNYEIDKMGTRHYRYTYTITNAHYETAEDCN